MSIRYFLYARKSSESEDRQMASIDDQINEMKTLASNLNLNIVDIITESKSAKAPGRQQFMQLLARIQAGEADGILCWKLNRLARNPVDGGQISWLLQRNIIKHIQTYGSSYLPTDNVLMMQVEFGMATQYVKDLSIDVKRGLRQKADRGWYPSAKLPIGYKHNVGALKEIVLDKKKSNQIKKLFSEFIKNDHSIASIKKYGDSIGLLSNRGMQIPAKQYKKILTDSFYYGKFHWKDEHGVTQVHQGKHVPIISEKEFALVQHRLQGTKRNTRISKYEHPYKSIMLCGACAGNITAEHKHQIICTSCKHKFSIKTRETCPKCYISIHDMESPSVIDKTYYHCTHKQKSCTQKSVNRLLIDSTIQSSLSKIDIPEEIHELLIDILRSVNKTEETKKITTLESKVKALEIKKSRLLEMRLDGELSKEEYQQQKDMLHQEITNRQQDKILQKVGQDTWLSVAEEYLNFASKAPNTFQKASDSAKNDIAVKLCSNLEILDKSPIITTKKSITRLKDCANILNSFHSPIEPKKRQNPIENQQDFDAIGVKYPKKAFRRGDNHDNRTAIITALLAAYPILHKLAQDVKAFILEELSIKDIE